MNIARRENVADAGNGVPIGELHCVVIDKREKCYRFQVQDKVVCAFIYGLDGRAFEVRRVVMDCECPKFSSPYPACAPMIIMDEGEERIFTKPGWYEICSCDGEPLPKDFTVDWTNLSECQAKTAVAEAHHLYVQQRDCEQKIARLNQ